MSLGESENKIEEVKSVIDPTEQGAVNTINSPENSDITKKIIENKFPNLNEINDNLKQQDYKTNKEQLIKNIIGRQLNQEYNRVSPDNTEYKNQLFLSEDIPQVRAYVAYYNLKITKSNAINKTDYPTIPEESFIESFEKEKPKKTENTSERKAPGVKLPPERVNQEVGKFIDISADKQQKITEKFGEIVSAGQKINKLTLYGYADATEVTPEGEKAVKDTFAALRQTLIDKGIDTNKLPPAEYFTGVETMELSNPQKQKVLNDGWAYTRAMMQIAFLSTEQIQYINENTTSLLINIDAKPVGGIEKGNQYTGGMIEMEATGSNDIIKKRTEIEDRLLKMIDIRQVNFAYAEGNQYYPMGGINLADKNGKLDINNVPFVNDAYFRSNRGAHSFTTDNKDQKTFFEDNQKMNTLRILINDPKQTEQKAKSIQEIDTRITDTGMDIAHGDNDFDAFIGALTEFKKNSTGDQIKEAYVDNTITLLQTYQKVDAELSKTKEIQKITI